MALRTTFALPTCRTKGTFKNWLRQTVEVILYLATCGFVRPGPRSSDRSDIRITDRYGNIYSFSQGTTEKQIEAILSVPTGEISAACSDVQAAFSKTDNLEIRIASNRSTAAENWRIIHACPDTGSGVCLVAENVARQAGMLLTPVENSKVYTANRNVMTISGTAKGLVKIEDSVRLCIFWVTPMMRDRLLLSRQQLMIFNIIPKTFPKIMRPKDGETLMCQTCANIVRQSHFEKLGQHHFVSLIDKKAPNGKVDSKDFYKSVINKACGHARKR